MDDDGRHDDRTAGPAASLIERLSRKVVGQPTALEYIVPYVQMYQAGLHPPDRPVGIFLLLGPTGTGKTRTVEALAEVLHGQAKSLLKIDCGEYQSDHEVAKLIGAPPGYLGHRETKPMLTPERLLEVVSPTCDLALVLFDEIEKAAAALVTLLLGILDKATLRLGDNTEVNFEKTLIFLTSNLGAREMLREVQPGIGFGPGPLASEALADRLESVGVAAVRKRFSPEFVNRIDVVITYQPLDAEAIAAILDHHVVELQHHVHTRLGERSFDIALTPEARQLVCERGASPEFGARELKRVIHRMLTQPLAAAVADGLIAPGSRVIVDRASDGQSLTLRPAPPEATEAAAAHPRVLVLDDNPHLLGWLGKVLEELAVLPQFAGTAEAARRLATQYPPDLALIDLVLPDGDGLSVAFELLRLAPRMQIVLMTGIEPSSDETMLCQRYNFPVLRKPFLGQDLVNLIRARLLDRRAARTAGRG